MFYFIADFSRPVIVIPWVVVQELDCIKDNKRGYLSNQVG